MTFVYGLLVAAAFAALLIQWPNRERIEQEALDAQKRREQ